MILSHRTSFSHHSHQQEQEHEEPSHNLHLHHSDTEDEQNQQQHQSYLYSDHPHSHDQETVIDTSDEAAQEEQTVPSGPTTTTPPHSGPCCNNCRHTSQQHLQRRTRGILQDMVPHRHINVIDPELEKRGVSGVPKLQKRALTVPKSPQFTRRVRPVHSIAAVATTASHNYHPYKGTSFGSHPTTTRRQPQPQLTQYKSYRSGITERGLVNSAESARRLSQERGATLSGGAGPIRIRTATTQQRVTRPPPPPQQQQQHHHHAGPAPKPKLTVPQPFKLRTQTRGERYQEQFKDKLTKWKKMEKEHHQFKALPLPAHKAPLFVPKKSTKPLTYSSPVVLQTDRRAEDREHHEHERRQKEKIMEDIKLAKAREDELRDLQETRRLRQKTVVRVTPIRHYNRIEIQKSTRPLTTPHSPNIGEKRKRREHEASQLSKSSHYHDSTLDGESDHDAHQHHVRQQQPPRLTAQERLEKFERSARRAPATMTTTVTAPTTTSSSSRAASSPRKIAMPSSTRRISASMRTNPISSSSIDDPSHHQQQNRIRAEIERQRAKDLAYHPPTISLEQKLQEIQQQHDEQMARERQQEAASQASYSQAGDSRGQHGYTSDTSSVQYTTTAASTSVTASRATKSYDEERLQRKRARNAWSSNNPVVQQNQQQPVQYHETSASETEVEYAPQQHDPLPPIRRPMGRKSWLEANDL
ncbi:hypothetical protein BGZ83_008560 [Gryganskiella cystojenkinii]|nr:hypothetical protein BGZ83_008560 [Gryganskiella cystojenkinii]